MQNALVEEQRKGRILTRRVGGGARKSIFNHEGHEGEEGKRNLSHFFIPSSPSSLWLNLNEN